jgi:phage recombination protein Bet
MQDVALRETREVDMPREKVEVLKQTVARGVTDLELQLFLHACKRTGLDPFMKQIHAVKRWSAKDQREVMSIQTGIDGYRLIADRTGCYAGSSDAEYELNDEGFPGFAKVTVTKLVNGAPCAFTASARWKEYCQLGKDGQPTSMWKKMPFLMLGKCAEALALRKAFPAELSGVYTHEEMMQADEQKPAYTDNKRVVAQKLAELTVEGIKPVEQDDAKSQQDAHTPTQQASDAAPPALSDNDDLFEKAVKDYCRLFDNATTPAECNKLYRDAPENLKGEIHPTYNKTLQGLNKKR